jgi:pimeloyl-[acyl-carrier protein] methyl ester esterase
MTKLTLLLLPGMDGTGELFESFIEALNGEFNLRIVTYPVDGTLGYEELEAIARTFVPLQEPYVIFGESFSGPIALSLAASTNENLKALILCCTFMKNPRPALAMLSGLVDFLPVTFAPETVSNQLLLGRFSTAALRKKLVLSLNKVSPSALKTRLKGVLSIDVSKKIANIKVPVLYLRASKDRLVPTSASLLIAELLPNIKIVEFDAPHFLLQTVPVEAAKVIGNFIRESNFFDVVERKFQKTHISALKEIIGKPENSVSIEKMNAAIAKRGAAADN